MRTGSRLIGVAAALTVAMVAGAARADDAIAFAEAAPLLSGSDPPPAACDSIACLIAHRYADDPKARTAALALYRDTGDVAGVGADEIMDGGYRGKIHLVPQRPVGRYREHLMWTLAAMRAIDAFFAAQFPAAATSVPPAYRWRALALRYVRSIGNRTPSAYAGSWYVEYNVEGSLMIDEASVEETLFHELFHANDEAHGDWSARTLTTDYAAIVARCGGDHLKVSCVAPYAPGTTIVRATGMYYSFQGNNGNAVHEYAAELAVRYYREQRELQTRGKLSHTAFKCGPPENARAWSAFVTEFFSGRDRVPSC